MVKSVFGGIVTGGVVSVVGVATLSLMSEPPAGTAPPMAPQVESPLGSAPQPPEPALAPTGDETPPAPEAAPAVAAPERAAEPEMPETEPTVIPQTGMPQTGPVPVEGDALPPVVPDMAPSEHTETAPPVPDLPALNPAPDVDTGAAMAPEAGPVMTEPAPAHPGAIAALPEQETQVLPSPLAQAPRTPLPERDIMISTIPADPLRDSDAEDSFIRISRPGSQEPNEGAETEPDSPTEDTAEAKGTPSTFAPVAPLKSDAGSLFDAKANTESDTEAEDGTTAALTAFAAPAPDPEGKPLLSVILIDDARIGLGPDAVSALPMPVSVALDGTGTGARARMEAYRAAGIETLALADLPETTAPGDQRIALEALFTALPETIGLLDTAELGLGTNRVAITEAINRLSADGRGLVTLSGGLGAALRAAEKDGVPAAGIYRDLDSEGQDAQVIRRFLDQAAFRARNEGQVVLLARLRPDTLSALDLWSNAERAMSVSLVPVSVQLLAQD